MKIQKIAVIDDEESIRTMYKLKLELEGYDVITAANGRDGLRVIQEFMPVLVLLDLRMPIMDGEEMLRALRKHAWAANIRVMILTNISKSEASANLRFLGVDRYIVKAHYTPHQVSDAVYALIGD